jgi:hypothetical protein
MYVVRAKVSGRTQDYYRLCDTGRPTFFVSLVTLHTPRRPDSPAHPTAHTPPLYILSHRPPTQFLPTTAPLHTLEDTPGQRRHFIPSRSYRAERARTSGRQAKREVRKRDRGREIRGGKEDAKGTRLRKTEKPR